MNGYTRADAVVVAWSTLAGERHRLVLEPGEGERWARVSERWDRAAGEWRHVGTEPVRDVELEAPRPGGVRPVTTDDRELWRYVCGVRKGAISLSGSRSLRLESEGEEIINSTSVHDVLHERTGEIETLENVNRSMRNLADAGLVNREPVEDHPGDHWTASKRGRQWAHALALELTQALGCPEAKNYSHSV